MDRVDRRDFLAGSAALTGATLLPFPTSVRAEPPEIEKIRFMHSPNICLAPTYLAIELLRLDGFAELPLISDPALGANLIADGHADFGMYDVPSLIPMLDTGKRVVVLAGIHAGCWELFANQRVQAIRDLKGKTVAISAMESGEHIFIASMLAYVGLNPKKTRELDGVGILSRFDALVRRRQGRRVPRVSPATPGTACEEDRPGHREYGARPALVPILLLHSHGKQRLCPQLPGRHQVGLARIPESHGHLRSGT